MFTPLSLIYCSEDDASPELDQDDTTYYQALLGVLFWALELGWIDISCEVSSLSSYLDLSCEGQLKQELHVFGFFRLHPKKSVYLNPGCILVPPERFQKFDWTDFYRDAQEEILLDAP